MLRPQKKMMLAITAAATCLSSGAYAGTLTQGPIDPNTGFPLWYVDGSGTAVQIGLDGPSDGTGITMFDPVIAGNAFSEQIGFGGEAFYWSAESEMDIAGGSALLVLALEAAFTSPTEEPQDGFQQVFTRLRIRIDTPVAGDYTVIHPYGEITFEDVVADDRGINYTLDTPLFDAVFGVDREGIAQDTFLDPLLRAVDPAPLEGYLGDARMSQTITGSPTGNNLFRIIGPDGSNLDGQGGNVIESNLFAVSGKTFAIPEPGTMGLLAAAGLVLGLRPRRRAEH